VFYLGRYPINTGNVCPIFWSSMKYYFFFISSDIDVAQIVEQYMIKFYDSLK
jgi:hypothetical protein